MGSICKQHEEFFVPKEKKNAEGVKPLLLWYFSVRYYLM